ncbi:uncharacterized protein METZ01_LOCUS457227, partial [marine metagenome]
MNIPVALILLLFAIPVYMFIQEE